MAAVLDINILCNKILETDIIEKLIGDYKTTIKSISSIENWMWENEQQINSLSQITSIMERDRIITINLISPYFKDLGIYIEKINDMYQYTLWINTEGYPELDSDMITPENKRYYEIIYQVISRLNNEILRSIEIAGIGIESDFFYKGKLPDTIQSSCNMVVWILNNDISIERLKNYKKRLIKGFNKILLEKIN